MDNPLSPTEWRQKLKQAFVLVAIINEGHSSRVGFHPVLPLSSVKLLFEWD